MRSTIFAVATLLAATVVAQTPTRPPKVNPPAKIWETPETASAQSNPLGPMDSVVRLQPRGDTDVSGDHGWLILDAAGSSDPASPAFGFGGTGAMVAAKASRPWVVAKAGQAGGTGGFGVYNSANAELFAVRSNGMISVGLGAGNLPATKFHIGDAVMTSGTNGGIFFRNRQAAVGAVTWGFYSQNGIARLWNENIGDVLTIDSAGSLVVTGNISAFGTINAKYQDVAEWVPSTENLSAGTVVVVDADAANHVAASRSAYDTAVAGVVSAHPGLVLGEASASQAMIATMGRVRVRVDATSNPIRIGDLLVTSDKTGLAMRSEPMLVNGRSFHQPGTILGKALEPLEKGQGEILVLLSLQ